MVLMMCFIELLVFFRTVDETILVCSQLTMHSWRQIPAGTSRSFGLPLQLVGAWELPRSGGVVVSALWLRFAQFASDFGWSGVEISRFVLFVRGEYTLPCRTANRY